MAATNAPEKEATDNVVDDELPEEERLAIQNADDEFLRSLEIVGDSSVGTIDGQFTSASQTTVAKKRKSSQLTETNVLLREFLDNRPKPSDFLPQKPTDDVQQFFDSMATTVRKFPALSIARIKMKVAQLIGEEEIAWAQEQARMQIVFAEADNNETFQN